jgi:hypothetical protein
LTAVTPSAVAASTAGLSITEEDHEGDSSFGTNGSSWSSSVIDRPAVDAATAEGVTAVKLPSRGAAARLDFVVHVRSSAACLDDAPDCRSDWCRCCCERLRPLSPPLDAVIGVVHDDVATDTAFLGAQSNRSASA